MAIRTNQKEFEYVIDCSIGFVLPDQLESRHHVVDLFGCSGQEQPAVDISTLLFRICEKLWRMIVFGVDGYRYDVGLDSELGPKLIGNLFHPRGEQKTWSGTGSVDEIEQYRLALQRGEGNLPTVRIDQRDVGQAVGSIAHREPSALPTIFSLLATSNQSERTREYDQHHKK